MTGNDDDICIICHNGAFIPDDGNMGCFLCGRESGVDDDKEQHT